MICIIEAKSRDEWLNSALNDIDQTIKHAKMYAYKPIICLAGGQSPKPLYEALAKRLASEYLYSPVIFIIGDERLKPKTPSYSNRMMIEKSLGPGIIANQSELIYWDVQAGSNKALSGMAKNIRTLAATKVKAKVEPFFDLCILGLGADGHCAGLFSSDHTASEKACSFWAKAKIKELALKTQAPEQPVERISLSPSLLASSAKTIFLLHKKGKEEAIKKLKNEEPDCPAVFACSKNCAAYVLV